MKKLLIFFLFSFLTSFLFSQEAIFKQVRDADSIKYLIENTKAGGAPVRFVLKNPIDSVIFRLDASGNFTIDGITLIEVESGTVSGQMLFWNSTWKHTETSELYWDDANKRLGIGTATPTEMLEVNGNAIISDTLKAKTGRSATITIAAYNSSALSKAQADYVCTNTDDEITINTSIDVLPAGGGKVFLMEGTYTLSNPIVILKSNVELTGSGWATILTLANAANTNVINIGNGIDDYNGVSISDLKVDGNMPGQAGGDGIGILVDKVTDVKIYHNYIYNIYKHGVIFQVGSLRGSVINNKFDVIAQGVTLGMSVSIHGSSHQCIVSNNIIEASECEDIQIYLSNQCIISDNIIFNSTRGSGIMVNQSNETSVKNNYCDSLGWNGIHIYQSDNNIIANNIVKNTNQSGTTNSGIHIRVASSKNIISNNRVFDDQEIKTQAYGIYIKDDACQGNSVLNNYLVGNNTGALSDNGTDTEIAGNYTETSSGNFEVQKGLILEGSAAMTSVSTGAADNDKMITQGYADDLVSELQNSLVSSYYNFNGSKITIPDNLDIQNIFDNGGSVSFRVNPKSDGESDVGRIIDKFIWKTFVSNESGEYVKITFLKEFSVDNGSWILTDAIIPLNKWTHICITYNASDINNDPIIYINGDSKAITEIDIPSGTSTTDVGNDMILGNRDTDNRGFDGGIANILFWTRILTSTKAKEISKWSSFNPPVLFEDIGASMDIVSTYDTTATQDLSITLNTGLNYTFIKGTADSLMIGTIKVISDSTFLYISGTVRANGGGAGDLTGSNLFHSGCVLNLNGDGMADDIWYDNSTNGHDGTNNGSTLIRNPHKVVDSLLVESVLEVDDAFILSGSTAMTAVSTGAGDNDKLPTQGYVDDAVGTVVAWTTWSPSLTWATNTPTINSAVYRYSRINNTIHFIVDIRATNSTGGNVEGLYFPLPITPKKIDVILPVSGQHTIGSYQLAVVYIDCEEALAADRTLHYRPFVFATATSASFYVSGFYEIE